MTKKTLTKTKYPNIYVAGNKHYLRKKINGKHVKKLLGSNLTDYQALILSVNLIKDLEKTITETIISETFESQCIKYVLMNKSIYSKGWESINKRNFEKLSMFNNRKLDDIKIDEFQVVFNKLLETLKPASVQKVKDSLSAMYNYYKVKNVASEIRLPKFDNKVYFTLPDEQIELLVNAIKNYPDLKMRCYMMLGLHGRRKNEIANLKWKDINFKEFTVHIHSTFSKNRKNMTYPILEELVNNLRKHHLYSGLPSKDEYVFQTKTGKPLYWIFRHWKTFTNSLGIEMRFHDLRHLIGYIAINKGISLEQIGATLGHSNLKTTQRYSCLKEDIARTVLKQIF